MKGELTAIIEAAPEGGYWAICREVPGANGQGESVDEAKASLRDAIRLFVDARTRAKASRSRAADLGDGLRCSYGGGT